MAKVEISNINVPGRTTNADGEKYEAMRAAIMKVTPKKAPGITASEMVERVRPLLPETYWPNGAKVGDRMTGDTPQVGNFANAQASVIGLTT